MVEPDGRHAASACMASPETDRPCRHLKLNLKLNLSLRLSLPFNLERLFLQAQS
jgi:hypothetical protein